MTSSGVCASCEKALANAVICQECGKIRYCSTSCQSSHYASHILDCNVKGPIDTAYYLARGCYTDTIPEHSQTRVDYGFDAALRAVGPYGESMLWGLYRELLVFMDVAPEEIGQWRREGRLAEHIKEAFATVPRDRRGGSYAWFLENQYVVDPSTPSPQALADQALQAAWVFIGRSKRDSANTIRSRVAKFTPPQYACFHFYIVTLAGAQYGPDADGWVAFGFVAAASPAAAVEMSNRYRELIERCTFKEFCNAYGARTIPALFRHYAIPVPDDRFFCDVLDPTGVKTVWLLKQYVDQMAMTEEVHGTRQRTVLSLLARYSYGYSNCKDLEEIKLLDSLYLQLFRKPGMDPIALHEACARDALLKYVKSNGVLDIPRRLQKSKYSRLLRRSLPPGTLRIRAATRDWSPRGLIVVVGAIVLFLAVLFTILR